MKNSNIKNKNMIKCRVCNNKIKPFMSFGKMPIANNFLKKKDFKKEYFFELKPCFCNKCFTFQLYNQPKPKKMFHDRYAFFSKTSSNMRLHFYKLFLWLNKKYLKKKQFPFVVEIGSNDGIFLENFAKKKIRHIGVEPSSNVAKVAQKNGVKTLISFFDKYAVKNILTSYGKADLVFLANVMCHIPKINDIAKNISNILKEDGFLIFEDPYLLEMLKKNSYDQIYDEHVFMFSAISVKNIFSKHGLKLVDAIEIDTHGGSMRYTLTKINNPKKETARLKKIYKYEKKYGIDKNKIYKIFKKKCETSKINLLKKLNYFKRINKKVIGYAATSKSTTILNYCKIDNNLVDHIIDTTPLKHYTFSPGMHIPILPYKKLLSSKSVAILLFAWNHKKEIFKKERNFIKKGGIFFSHIYE